MAPRAMAVLDVDGLQALLDLLRADGWTVLGPTIRDGVVTHGEITSVDDFPRGVGDEQDAGHYRLRERDDDAFFGYAVGPQSWKAELFPAHELLARREPDASGVPPRLAPEARAVALFGVRSCDLHAIAIHDHVLLSRSHADVHYGARRAETLTVAVSCSDPGGTCFCASTGTGPSPTDGFDLSLTELLDDNGHRFVVRSGGPRGDHLLDRLPALPVDLDDLTAHAAVTERAVSVMGRQLDLDGLRDLLYDNSDHPQWDDVATRCLSCTNCTLVCPTCFCTSVEDTADLVDGSTERWRVWDSCFTSEFSAMHGGSVRTSTRSRYRQWATHKLASWIDQFGTSGCVGCGRCITWCPAAIDLTAEVAAIRATPAAGPIDQSDPAEA
ncbi:MAG: 4Fe-4S dicluster domain-containing protein [Actinomycetota bacterium]|nr:4Fe-4S dicluster domain-containing protein [Actinomycetota bacterium]